MHLITERIRTNRIKEESADREGIFVLWDTNDDDIVDESEWRTGTTRIHGEGRYDTQWVDWDADGDSELDLNSSLNGNRLALRCQYAEDTFVNSPQRFMTEEPLQRLDPRRELAQCERAPRAAERAGTRRRQRSSRMVEPT